MTHQCDSGNIAKIIAYSGFTLILGLATFAMNQTPEGNACSEALTLGCNPTKSPQFSTCSSTAEGQTLPFCTAKQLALIQDAAIKAHVNNLMNFFKVAGIGFGALIFISCALAVLLAVFPSFYRQPQPPADEPSTARTETTPWITNNHQEQSAANTDATYE